MWPNINKFLKNWDQALHNFSLFLGQHCILPYTFANILFQMGPMGSVFTINDDVMIDHSFNFWIVWEH